MKELLSCIVLTFSSVIRVQRKITDILKHAVRSKKELI